MDWLDEAACKGKHMDIWFPPMYGDEPATRASHNLYYDIARMVCDVCSIRKECDVLGTDEEYGMWGGRSPQERFRKLPYTPPRRSITLQQVIHTIPKHNAKVPIDIKSLRVSVAALSIRKKSG